MFDSNLFLTLLWVAVLALCFTVGALIETLYKRYKSRGKLPKEYVPWAKR